MEWMYHIQISECRNGIDRTWYAVTRDAQRWQGYHRGPRTSHIVTLIMVWVQHGSKIVVIFSAKYFCT